MESVSKLLVEQQFPKEAFEHLRMVEIGDDNDDNKDCAASRKCR